MKYKCVMCEQLIGKKEDQWGMKINSLRWIHYKCIEHLWEVYSSMRKQDGEK